MRLDVFFVLDFFFFLLLVYGLFQSLGGDIRRFFHFAAARVEEGTVGLAAEMREAYSCLNEDVII